MKTLRNKIRGMNTLDQVLLVMITIILLSVLAVFLAWKHYDKFYTKAEQILQVAEISNNPEMQIQLYQDAKDLYKQSSLHNTEDKIKEIDKRTQYCKAMILYNDQKYEEALFLFSQLYFQYSDDEYLNLWMDCYHHIRRQSHE